MPSHKTLASIADFFYIFSDITRIKMIIALAVGEMCVNELVDTLSLNQSTVSHQLKLLRDNNIVSYKRSGKQLYYYICNNNVGEVMMTGVKSLE
jgi:ArsR family transcriptional regulator